MTGHKDNPAEIYLVPMLGDDSDHIWCEDPAPGEGMRDEDATRYVRADLVPESNAVLSERIADLTRKNSDLAAQVEQWRGGLNQAIELLVTALNEPQQITESEIHDLRTLEKSTPAQLLAERDAEVAAKAVEDFYKALMRSENISADGKEIVCGIYMCRPDPLRQLAKGGGVMDRDKLASDLFVALIGNPERYKYIADKVKSGELSNEEATAKNINKAYMLADQFIDTSNALSQAAKDGE